MPVPVAESLEPASGFWANHLFSVSQNGVLVFSGSRQQTKPQLTWLDRSGKILGTVGTPGFELAAPRISPDGTNVAYSMSKDIWLHDLPRNTSSRFTFSAKASESLRPAWYADGQYLAFQQNNTIVRKAVGRGHALEPLVGWPGEQGVDFSPDGRYMAGVRLAVGAGYDFWIQPLEPPGAQARAYLHGPTSERSPAFSPSEDWLAYEILDSAGTEVFVQSFQNSGLKYQVSTEGGQGAVWSRDAKELYFLSPDRQMMAASVRNSVGKLEIGVPQGLFDARTIPVSNRVVSGGAVSSPAIHLFVNWQAALKP